MCQIMCSLLISAGPKRPQINQRSSRCYGISVFIESQIDVLSVIQSDKLKYDCVSGICHAVVSDNLEAPQCAVCLCPAQLRLGVLQVL